jgi:hypothetical protein
MFHQRLTHFFHKSGTAHPCNGFAAHRIETAGIAAACVVIAAGTGYWHWEYKQLQLWMQLARGYQCGDAGGLGWTPSDQTGSHQRETLKEAQTLLAAGWGVGGTRKEEPVTIDIGGGKQITLIPHRGRPNLPRR